uniref:Uncharacterized protein n=1 Tax=Ceratitis capitata TaxID=7213 RepID=W8BYQ0_CERCA
MPVPNKNKCKYNLPNSKKIKEKDVDSLVQELLCGNKKLTKAQQQKKRDLEEFLVKKLEQYDEESDETDSSDADSEKTESDSDSETDSDSESDSETDSDENSTTASDDDTDSDGSDEDGSDDDDSAESSEFSDSDEGHNYSKHSDVFSDEYTINSYSDNDYVN